MGNEFSAGRLPTGLCAGASQVEHIDRHPDLSVTDRIVLAERISSVDGVTFAEAHRQIEDFLSTDLLGSSPDPPNVNDGGSEAAETPEYSALTACSPGGD